MSMWNPWRGCKKCSDGCLHCYIHKGDYKRGINTSDIVRTKDFGKPIEKLKNGSYKMKSGMVYLCFSTDFFIEEADEWRDECWKMIRERQDCTFLFLTKRIDRFSHCIPKDWESGYDNVVICCTIENQRNADYKLSIFQKLPIKHKCITAQPLIENIEIEKYLDGIELVVVGGISFKVFPKVQMAACIFHKGSYNTLHKSYAMLLQYIEENGYQICGNIRESYIDGIWNKETENDWLTEIQIPVKK